MFGTQASTAADSGVNFWSPRLLCPGFLPHPLTWQVYLATSAASLVGEGQPRGDLEPSLGLDWPARHHTIYTDATG